MNLYRSRATSYSARFGVRRFIAALFLEFGWQRNRAVPIQEAKSGEIPLPVEDDSFRIGAEMKPASVVVASSFNRAPKEAAARVL